MAVSAQVVLPVARVVPVAARVVLPVSMMTPTALVDQVSTMTPTA